MNQPWRIRVNWRQYYTKNCRYKHNESNHNKTVRTFHDMYDHPLFSVQVISIFLARGRNTILAEMTGIS